jgi:hypothetical protein
MVTPQIHHEGTKNTKSHEKRETAWFKKEFLSADSRGFRGD